MRAIAPGKLIISGEHAVVYGRPALAMAIDRFAESMVTTEVSDRVSFHLLDLKESDSFTLRALQELKTRLVKNYNMFLNGELGIRDVLLKPIDLFEFAFITILDGLHVKLSEGLNIQTHSNIPIGCGMGSSAATVLSLLRAIGHYFRVDFKPEWYLRYSMEAEKLQHGHPSGVDSYISLHGGCALFQNGATLSVPLPRIPMYIVQTGKPAATTGECVVRVAEQFKNAGIWSDFESVTLAMTQAIRANKLEDVQQCVRDNHRLLSQIGVVPEKVRNFVTEIEEHGGAAKICGAGSITGDQGGIVLVFSETVPVDVCTKYGYTIIPVRGDPLGVRMV